MVLSKGPLVTPGFSALRLTFASANGGPVGNDEDGDDVVIPAT